MSTPTVNLTNPVFRGNRFDFAGTADFSGSDGSVVFYIDPKPTGTPLGPYPLTPEGINFAELNLKLGGGKWKIRIVATPTDGDVVIAESPDIVINEVIARAVMPLVGGAPTTNPVSNITNINPETHTDYRVAINAAGLGNKRLAAAALIIDQMSNKQRLIIMRDNVRVIIAEYAGLMTVSNESDVVAINTSTMIFSDNLVNADLTSGRWHYRFQGGPNYSVELRGSVGGPASGKNIILSDSPKQSGFFNSTFSFIIPAIIDA